MASEFVRQELRAVVRERTQQQLNNVRPPQSPIGSNAMIGNVNNNTTTNNNNNTNNNNHPMTMGGPQQISNSMMNSTADMGFNFELPTTGN